MDEKHILVSLGDDKVKQIGEVIGNKTCNKILDLLTESELTTTEISKKLKIPLNTVDYNMKKLIKSGLIESASNWWSVKGKKIKSYKISNKKIIISPKKSTKNIFIWTALVTGFASLIIKFTTRTRVKSIPLEESFASRADVILESVAINNGISDMALETVSNSGFSQSLGPWSWFLLGAWISILLFFILTLWSERRNKNKK